MEQDLTTGRRALQVIRRTFPNAVAFFLGSFAVLNLVGELRAPGFDANLWWLDLRFLPLPVARAVMGGTAFVLIVFALVPPVRRSWQVIFVLSTLVLAAIAGLNVLRFYREWIAGAIHPAVPVPLSLFVVGALLLIIAGVDRRVRVTPYWQHLLGLLVGFAVCAFVFPLLQVFCFGKTDYRRPADVIVVLGARTYADGRPSDALADRVRTACALYRDGLASKIIMSGGPGDGAIHETEGMRRLAVTLGVRNEDILQDTRGINTQATVNHTVPILERLNARRVLVVSHFYHLPRIKLTYQRAGVSVFTVPAKETYFLKETPYMIFREVAALWVYYLRPLGDG